ncbi:hypothetical protein PC41400_25865 [Paenibacillus chitinolyticus]|uniref:Uncharacterized protein n=1 Tax=Paenibacillus chitinolyticus TaxID=79263 RepID=A0A410X2S3_9BACL|nr:hypothetical protein PC41400_25865 [Paenibacillus chitinolyticus]
MLILRFFINRHLRELSKKRAFEKAQDNLKAGYAPEAMNDTAVLNHRNAERQANTICARKKCSNRFNLKTLG